MVVWEQALGTRLAIGGGRRDDAHDLLGLVEAAHLAAHKVDARAGEQVLVERRDLPAGGGAGRELVEHRREGEALVTIDERHARPRSARPVEAHEPQRRVEAAEAATQNGDLGTAERGHSWCRQAHAINCRPRHGGGGRDVDEDLREEGHFIPLLGSVAVVRPRAPRSP